MGKLADEFNPFLQKKEKESPYFLSIDPFNLKKENEDECLT